VVGNTPRTQTPLTESKGRSGTQPAAEGRGKSLMVSSDDEEDEEDDDIAEDELVFCVERLRMLADRSLDTSSRLSQTIRLMRMYEIAFIRSVLEADSLYRVISSSRSSGRALRRSRIGRWSPKRTLRTCMLSYGDLNLTDEYTQRIGI
jgi:hypothetical protein